MIFSGFDIAVFQWLNGGAGISFFWDWAILFGAIYLWHAMALAVIAFGAASFLPRFQKARAVNLRFFVHTVSSALAARYFVTELIRLFYNRPRPFEVFPDAVKFISHAPGHAFPSGHAALAFAVAAAAAFYYPKTSFFFFFAALSIGVGRVAAGVHWPSDIVAGAAVGIVG